MMYGRVFAGLMLLWPLLALLGTPGFAPLVGITGLAALALARPKWPVPPYALAFFAFIAWAAVSEAWSPVTNTLISGSLADGTFAIGARSMIIVLTALFAALTLAAATTTRLSGRSAFVLYGVFASQTALVLVTAAFSDQLIEFFYGSNPQEAVSGVQNLGRNINIFALVLPFLAGLLFFRGGRAGLVAGAGLIGLFLWAALKTDNQSAIFAVIGMLVAWGVIAALPRNGFRWLLSTWGAYILVSPLLIGGLVRIAPAFSQSLPDSFRSRLWSWEVVTDRIGEAPIAGHGLMATRTWRETYSDHPEWLAQLPDFWSAYPVVPGHPHNMALQIWAETGLVGALLAAAALVLLAFRLPAPSALRPEFRLAIAGMIGAAVMIFSFSYSIWAEAFWAGVALIAASLVFLARKGRETP